MANSSVISDSEGVRADVAKSPIRKRFTWHIAALLLIVILFGLIRWRLAAMPLERDEGEYAYAGQLMLEHIPPYKFAYNMKLPGTYAAYAVLMAIFGETDRGIHVGVLFVNAGTIVLMFVLGSRMFGRTGGVVAAATYGLLSTHQQTLGFAGHATHFVILAALTGLILLLRAIERDRSSLFFCSGILFGFAFLMKQPGILFGVFGFVYLLFVYLRRPVIDWAWIAKCAGIFLAGCSLPFGLTCLWLWRAGVFPSFWFWTVSYARQYSALISLADGWGLFTYHFVPLFFAAPVLWIIAALGVSASIWNPESRKHAALILGLLVSSFLAVSSGLYFRGHYFIMLLPAVALLTGVAVVSASDLLQLRTPNRWLRSAPLIILLLGWGWAIGKNAGFYFRMTPNQACHVAYGNSPFIDAIPIAQYLQQHTSATDRVAVLGSEPEIFFYSHRLSSTGYIYVYALMEKQPYWQKMQRQMIDEIEANRPAYLIYSNQPGTWLMTMGSSRLGPFLDWASAYVKNNYEQVGLVELADPESHFTWGTEAKKMKSRTLFFITVYKRKDYTH
jgi:4-amino-4-deoxy-L-arabinose transferase-like glycosyltransferase